MEGFMTDRQTNRQTSDNIEGAWINSDNQTDG